MRRAFAEHGIPDWSSEPRGDDMNVRLNEHARPREAAESGE